MKKMHLLAIAVLGVCGSMTNSYADDDATSSMVTPMTTDEATFAAQLTDANQTTFMNMPSDVRADCMKMSQEADANGMSLTPDQAVEKMASLTGGVAVNGCAVQ